MDAQVPQIGKRAALAVAAFDVIHNEIVSEGSHLIERRELKTLVSQGWRYAYTELFGETFVDVLAAHHIEAVEWHWDSRLAFLKGERPAYLAYFPIWSRGHLKSSLAERMVVIDAVLSTAYGQPGYCLYVAREKTKVKDYIGNIERLLSSEKVRLWCPQLSEVARNEETNQKRQWTGTYLSTAANYVVKGGTVESAQAGSRVDETRPTFIVPDDIDGREDSVVMSESRFRALTGEILPMRQANTLVYFAQNLISKYSVMYRIQTGRDRVLTNRKPTVPIPAVIDLVTEERVVDGIVKDVFVSGTPTWKYWDTQRIQDEIDTEGLKAFLRECQHDIEGDQEGRVHKRFDDNVHPISRSEFAAVFGDDAWKSWYKVVFNDWSRTKTKFHANVGGYVAVSNASTPLPGLTFLIPMSFKADTTPEDVAVRFLSELTPYAYGTTTWEQLVADVWKRVNEETHFHSVSEQLEYTKNYYKSVIPKYSRPVLSLYNVRAGVNSHSEDKVREMFNDGFGFMFQPANPTKHEAIEDIEAAMKVDYDADHLFRDAKGYTRWYVICKDDFTQAPRIVNGRSVYPPVPFPNVVTPDALHDDDLFRWQMMNRRYAAPKLTETGETVDALLKLDDDFGQALQFIYSKKLLTNRKLSKEEVFMEELSRKGLDQASIDAVQGADQLKLVRAQLEAAAKFHNQNKKSDGRMPWRR